MHLSQSSPQFQPTPCYSHLVVFSIIFAVTVILFSHVICSGILAKLYKLGRIRYFRGHSVLAESSSSCEHRHVACVRMCMQTGPVGREAPHLTSPLPQLIEGSALHRHARPSMMLQFGLSAVELWQLMLGFGGCSCSHRSEGTSLKHL